MPTVTVLVYDKVGDSRRLRLALETDLPVSGVINAVVRYLKLPRYSFFGKRLRYWFNRPYTDGRLEGNMDLAHVMEGETLELISPTARNIKRSIPSLLYRIWDEIWDRSQGEIVDDISKYIRDAITGEPLTPMLGSPTGYIITLVLNTICLLLVAAWSLSGIVRSLFPNAIPGATPTPFPTPDSLVLVSVSSITILDHSGASLGDGELTVYAPQELMLGEYGEIILEIEVTHRATAESPLSATPTPEIVTPRSLQTLTPLPIQGMQFISIREVMKAELGGVDIGNFEVTGSENGGEQLIDRDGITTWNWTIRATDTSAAGLNRLEAHILLPREIVETGAAADKLVNMLPIEIDVILPATPTPTPLPLSERMKNNPIMVIIGALGIVVAFFAGVLALPKSIREAIKAIRRRDVDDSDKHHQESSEDDDDA